MQYNIFCIFVIAAFGVCHCDDSTDDGDTDDSSSSAEEGRCNGSPYYLRGLMRQRGWFYDQSRDECRLYYFGDNNWNERKNKFRTVEECRKTCRSKVPLSCFATPEEDPRKTSFPMFWYNRKQGMCEDITASDDAAKVNVFRHNKTCNSKCRDPELGKCAPSALKNCSSHESNNGYHFDVETKTCKEVKDGKCGPFPSLEACFQRCGRYISKKCNMPALTSMHCDIEEKRYWYNSSNNKCEEIDGCADDVTNFRTAQECWKTCSSEQSSRCLKTPDLGRVRFGWTRYYYDITDNTCKKTTRVAFWQRSSNKNNFKTHEECTQMCKPKYKGDVKKI